MLGFFEPHSNTECSSIRHITSSSALVLSLLEPSLDAGRQRQLLDVVDAGVLADAEPAQILQRPDLSKPRHRPCQPHRERRRPGDAGARVAEDARLGVRHRVLHQVYDRPIGFGLRLRVEAEDSVAVLNPCVQRPAIRPKHRVLKIDLQLRLPQRHRLLYCRHVTAV